MEGRMAVHVAGEGVSLSATGPVFIFPVVTDHQEILPDDPRRFSSVAFRVQSREARIPSATLIPEAQAAVIPRLVPAPSPAK